MTIEPAVLIAVIGTLGGLLVLAFRLLLTGSLLPRNAVVREDYEALMTANASLRESIPALAEAVSRSAATTEKALAALARAVAALAKERKKNGGTT